MKWLMILFSLQAFGAPLRSPKDFENQSFAAAPSVKITWSFPASEESPDLTFNLRSSTSLSVPMCFWVVVTNVPGTNRSCVLPMDKPQEFFSLTASNWLGESGYATK